MLSIAAMRALPIGSMQSPRQFCVHSKALSSGRGAHGKPVTVCGELASQPLGALALVALGYRAFSLSPSSVGPVKAMLLRLHASKAAAFIAPLIESRAAGVSIRERLKEFAAGEQLQIEGR